MRNKPKVSIITATYNNLNNLKRIIESVRQQDYSNIEHIIIDGKSNDGTNEYLHKQPNIEFISEKDNGIYDAINKGLNLSTGEIIGFCFDEFTDCKVISKIVQSINEEKSDGVHGDLLYLNGDKVVRTWHQGQGNIRFGWMPGHPTLYLKREVYAKYGIYKTNYIIAADYEFMIRILKDKKVKLAYIPETLIKMSHGGTSTNGVRSYILSLKEGHRALKENKIKFAWFTDFCRTIKVIRQFLN
jgi:glycosyltransferase